MLVAILLGQGVMYFGPKCAKVLHVRGHENTLHYVYSLYILFLYVRIIFLNVLYVFLNRKSIIAIDTYKITTFCCSV